MVGGRRRGSEFILVVYCVGEWVKRGTSLFIRYYCVVIVVLLELFGYCPLDIWASKV